MTDLKPWYLSKTIWGAAIAIAASAAGMLGIPVGPAEQAGLADAILQAIGAGGAVLAAVGRIVATSRLL